MQHYDVKQKNILFCDYCDNDYFVKTSEKNLNEIHITYTGGIYGKHMMKSSHGIENLFAVEFPSFPLNHLTPPRLAGMLERSGIRNRIVIISACHSGSFIPALRHPTTMVMTAARSDRASFGCSNESDWTYFGNALFNHGLRATTSLPKAFASAKVLIGEWEAKEKFRPSEPQIFIGDQMTPILERLARLPAAGPAGAGSE